MHYSLLSNKNDNVVNIRFPNKRLGLKWQCNMIKCSIIIREEKSERPRCKSRKTSRGKTNSCLCHNLFVNDLLPFYFMHIFTEILLRDVCTQTKWLVTMRLNTEAEIAIECERPKPSMELSTEDWLVFYDLQGHESLGNYVKKFHRTQAQLPFK